jgi:hypothetical protein
MSLVLPHLHKIRSHELAEDEDDSPVKAAFKKALLVKFDERFGGALLFSFQDVSLSLALSLSLSLSLSPNNAVDLFEDVSLPSIASALDPRTGGLKMLTSTARDLTWQTIAGEAQSVLGDQEAEPGMIPVTREMLVCLFATV